MMTTRPIVPGGGRKLAACVISLALAAAAVVAVGCTPGAYRRSADLQVHELLKDRKERTLGYTPQSAAPVQTPDRPPKRAYSKIPMTAKAPPTTSPVEPEGVEVSFGPLGPTQFPPAMAVPLGEEFGIESLRGIIAQRSMLGPPAPAPAPQRFDLFASLARAPSGRPDDRRATDGGTSLSRLLQADVDVQLKAGQLITAARTYRDFSAAMVTKGDSLKQLALRLAGDGGYNLELEGKVDNLASAPKGTVRGHIVAETPGSIAPLAALLGVPAAFRPGDSRRHIHWRTTARRGTLMVREFEDWPSDNLILLVDPWTTRPPGADDDPAVECLLSLAGPNPRCVSP